ncbi:MAG: phasin family protein [Paracoccaceae bacterium]
MAQKTPFDFTEMMRAFDPQKMAQMFDPQKIFAQMQAMQGRQGMPDLSDLMEGNRRNFEAMVEANAAAAETYRAMLDRQMEIFNRMTAAARDYAGTMETGAPDAASRNAQAYSEAVETALGLMQEMAEATREANEKVFADMQKRVTEAIDGLGETPKD